ncbi:unnamed protein product [Nesidiocoris tenuis]|uniref:RanBP2-type domain-containing protein n=1 Tax=Nesidiocoris tenuis TaxID=355587 RepID=A0A6H5G5Y6_9HEMI|nr:unnamed protein product [Nesidiocoris tenuis]
MFSYVKRKINRKFIEILFWKYCKIKIRSCPANFSMPASGSSQFRTVLRIQTSEGTKRINVNLGDSLTSVYEKVFAEFSLPSFNFSLFRHRNGSSPVESLKSETVASIGLKHGDILYLQPVDGATLFPQAATAHSTPGTSGSSTSQSTPSSGDPGFEPPAGTNNSRGASTSFVEDEVDKILSATEGKIMRKKDPKLCHHSANGCCIHCSPLEPYDEAYLREQNIKHLSFHSYLRKLTGGMDKYVSIPIHARDEFDNLMRLSNFEILVSLDFAGKFVALENTSCRIKPGCKDHPPWPKGICSKCQPSAVTLNRQSYRHVDNVMFENPQIVERFLEYWRISGHQRVGYLYGKYEVHADVPLGIRATVAAIYEPPQVKHVRNINTHFLSAQECITAGYLQNLHPNPCKFSSTGHFGSKFTTVCVTGDSSKQVHMEGYAVSSQCMSLVRDHCLIPTKDMPQLGYVPESTDKQYVPDVYYKEKDSYGNEVSKLARPLPVEYLLVDVPVSTPLTPVYSFRSDPAKNPFPVENRLLDKHIQDFNALSAYFQQFTAQEFLAAVSDFHVLLYISTMEMLPMKEHMGPLLQAVKEQDVIAATVWSRSEQWATVEQLISAYTREGPGAAMDGVQSQWTCPYCTFLNPSHLNACEMCSLPR